MGGAQRDGWKALPMAGNGRGAGQSRPQPVTTGHELEGRAGGRGQGNDRTWRRVPRAGRVGLPSRCGPVSRVTVSHQGVCLGRVAPPRYSAAVEAARLVWVSL